MTRHPTRKKDDYVHNFKSITGISKRKPRRKERKKKKKGEIEAFSRYSTTSLERIFNRGRSEESRGIDSRDRAGSKKSLRSWTFEWTIIFVIKRVGEDRACLCHVSIVVKPMVNDEA